MSIRSNLEFVVASLTVLALFAGFLYWIDARVVEASERSNEALLKHLSQGSHDEAVTEEEVWMMVRGLKTQVRTNTSLLHRLDERSKNILFMLKKME